MNGSVLAVVVNPLAENRAVGYETWSLAELAKYNQDALAAGSNPVMVAIAFVNDIKSSRLFIEDRLSKLSR